MRRAARIDSNQNEIVNALRQVGATVTVTSAIGDGYPDLTVGFRGQNFLLEVKDGNKQPSKRTLTPAEQTWHDTWQGEAHVVEDIEAALRVIGAIT